MPAGITTRHAYETLNCCRTCNAGPVDVALFGLHGAMVADGYDDCEGDLLRARDRRPGHGDRRGAGRWSKAMTAAAMPEYRHHHAPRL